MMRDVITIIWKEWKEVLLQGGSRGRYWPFLFVLVVGVILPLQGGNVWVDTPAGLILSAWLPLLLVNNLIADSFAGERERHTLETLLASRLSDKAILMGKILASAIYAWVMTMIVMLVVLITANASGWQGQIRLYPLEVIVGSPILAFLSALFSTLVGVHISLRASSVRQAQQTLGLAVMLLIFVPTFGINLIPIEWRESIGQWLLSLDITQAISALGIVVVALDYFLLLWARSRFKRSELILD
ncbi:MAG: ABC transporter permease [Anaerolineales bacterium]|jgi:ABC-2 type transport system permease protein